MCWEKGISFALPENLDSLQLKTISLDDLLPGLAQGKLLNIHLLGKRPESDQHRGWIEFLTGIRSTNDLGRFDRLPFDLLQQHLDRIHPRVSLAVLKQQPDEANRLSGYRQVLEREPNFCYDLTFQEFPQSALEAATEFYTHLNTTEDGQARLVQWLDQVGPQQVSLIVKALGDERARQHYQASIQGKFSSFLESAQKELKERFNFDQSKERSLQKGAIEQLIQAARLGVLSADQIDQTATVFLPRANTWMIQTDFNHPYHRLMASLPPQEFVKRAIAQNSTELFTKLMQQSDATQFIAQMDPAQRLQLFWKFRFSIGAEQLPTWIDLLFVSPIPGTVGNGSSSSSSPNWGPLGQGQSLDLLARTVEQNPWGDNRKWILFLKQLLEDQSAQPAILPHRQKVLDAYFSGQLTPFADQKLVIGDVEFPLCSQLLEGREGVIPTASTPIECEFLEMVHPIIGYLYSGEVRGVDGLDRWVDLLLQADAYQMPHLVNVCLGKIENTLGTEALLPLIERLNQRGEDKVPAPLWNLVKGRVARELPALQRRAEWASFLQGQPKAFIRGLLVGASEQTASSSTPPVQPSQSINAAWISVYSPELANALKDGTVQPDDSPAWAALFSFCQGNRDAINPSNAIATARLAKQWGITDLLVLCEEHLLSQPIQSVGALLDWIKTAHELELPKLKIVSCLLFSTQMETILQDPQTYPWIQENPEAVGMLKEFLSKGELFRMLNPNARY